jgi:mono/diheme cytochrome c family protein
MRIVSLGFALLVLAAGCGQDGAGSDTGSGEAAVGDPKRGAVVFSEQGCGNCHTFAAAGSTKNQGPNLDDVASRYDAAFIRQSIVDPSAYIERGAEGSIGGDRSYRNIMLAFGPNPTTEANRLTEQQLADLVGFLTHSR